MGGIEQKIYLVSIMALPFLLAVTWREALRGYVAHKMGDSGVQAAGRLSANPLNHADPIWTGVVPIVAFVLLQLPILFGQAKPIVINTGRFKDVRRGTLYLAISGPAALFFMAIFWAYVFRFGAYWGLERNGWIMSSADLGSQLSCIFFVIGMLPIPGLDGGKIVEHFLPYEAAQSYRKLEPYAFFIIIGIFVFAQSVIIAPARLMINIVGWLVGV